MLGNIIGGALGAAGSLLGAKKQNQAIAQANQNNYMAQKEFAQNGIQWRVEDAKKAGLHPLYALGAGGATYSPSSQVGTEGVSGAFRSIGQSISNMQSSQEREFNRLNIEGKRLDNQLRAEQIKNLQAERDLAKIGQSPAGAIMNNNIKAGVPQMLKKEVSKIEGIEDMIAGYRTYAKGNGTYGIEPSKDRVDWLQDLSIANTGDAIAYLADKYSISSRNEDFWRSKAKELTNRMKAAGKLGAEEYYQAEYGIEGWHFRKRNLSYRSPVQKFRDFDNEYTGGWIEKGFRQIPYWRIPRMMYNTYKKIGRKR